MKSRTHTFIWGGDGEIWLSLILNLIHTRRHRPYPYHLIRCGGYICHKNKRCLNHPLLALRGQLLHTRPYSIQHMHHTGITTIARGYSRSHDELAWWTASCAVKLVSCHVDRASGASAVAWLHLRLSHHGNAVGAHHATALGLMWHGSAHAVVERVGVGAGTTHSRAACEHLASTPPHPWWKGP